MDTNTAVGVILLMLLGALVVLLMRFWWRQDMYDVGHKVMDERNLGKRPENKGEK